MENIPDKALTIYYNFIRKKILLTINMENKKNFKTFILAEIKVE